MTHYGIYYRDSKGQEFLFQQHVYLNHDGTESRPIQDHDLDRIMSDLSHRYHHIGKNGTAFYPKPITN